MKGQGGIVFLIAFFALLAATLAAPSIPPGRAFYDILGVPDTDYPVLGIPVTTLVIAVFNDVFYGIIAWLVFTFGRRIIHPT